MADTLASRVLLTRSLAALAVATVALVSHASTAVAAQSSLARAYRIIAGKEFVDLTHSFGPDTPVWA